MGLVYKRAADQWQIESYTDSSGESVGAISVQSGKFALQYPLTLDSSPEFGQNKVVFFINVSGNGKISSKLNETDDYRGVVRDLPQNEYYKASGEKLKELIRKAPVDSTGTGVVTAPIKRLMAAITLYIPNTLSNTYAVNWTEDDLSGGAFVEDIIGATGSMLGVSTGSAGAKETGFGEIMKGQLLRKTVDTTSYMQKASRTTSGNSKAEQLFKGVEFRSFSYDYEFAPRSAAEAAAVLNIIRMFKHHMLPEYADNAGGYMFVYPSEFDIKYFKGSNENTYLEKQMTAVLTNCTVNYTPNGQFNTFENGMPTQIRLQLQFRELGLATKETSPFNESGI